MTSSIIHIPAATQPDRALDELYIALFSQRDRLVRYCARFVGSVDAAEDMAQETLIAAWQHAAQIRQPEAADAWLFGIARNMCRRWLRRQYRAPLALGAHAGAGDSGVAADLPDSLDLQIELERDELATLLDRALELLPPETRAVLVHKYVEESPHAEIAQRLGISEGAVAMRLQRGRLAFRRILSTDLRDEARPYGLAEEQHEPAIETRIWCPFCGAAKLLHVFDPANGATAFYCAASCTAPRGQITWTNLTGLIADLTSYKSILSRQITRLDQYYRDGMAARAIMCLRCGATADVRFEMSERRPIAFSKHGVEFFCPTCSWFDSNPLSYLVLDLPATQRFWRRNPRMRILPQQPIEFGGRSAIITSFESTGGMARLDVISAADTLAVLAIHDS